MSQMRNLVETDCAILPIYALFYIKSLDQSISNRRCVWLGFTVTMFYRNFCILFRERWA